MCLLLVNEEAMMATDMIGFMESVVLGDEK
jgi:hypothetical protein